MLSTVKDNILSFWLTNMVDNERGGFYGQMRGDGTLVADADKGGILNARILWSFSAAYRVLHNPESPPPAAPRTISSSTSSTPYTEAHTGL